MTKFDLIQALKSYPDNMEILISVPYYIYDDGYKEWEVRKIDEVYLSDERPVIMLSYDRYTSIE